MAEEEKKKSKKKILLCVLIPTLLVGGAVSGHFIYKYVHNKQVKDAIIKDIENLNTKLKDVVITDNPTVYSRLKTANFSNDDLKKLDKNYYYSYKNNKFLALDASYHVVTPIDGYNSGDEVLKSNDLYTFVDSSKLSNNYSNYVVNVSDAAKELTILTCLDVGEATNISKISFTNNENAGKEIMIRTNGGILNIDDTHSDSKQIHYGMCDTAWGHHIA